MSFYDHFSEEQVAILRKRAERIARTQREIQQGDIITALVIQAGGETYALPIEALVAVYVEHTIIPVPSVPAFIAGVANIRGQILSVLDLAALMKGTDRTEQHALIVATNGEASVAFCAEDVGETTTFPSVELEAIPAGLNGAYLQGMLPGRSALLNLQAIFNDEMLIIDEAVS